MRNKLFIIISSILFILSGCRNSKIDKTNSIADDSQNNELTFVNDDWKANWIWLPESKKNTWVCFRKNLILDKVPSKTNVKIAVDSKYWLWINGKQVVFEGGLNRGPDSESGYYDVLDIQPYLTEGKNVIAVLVWYWGNAGRNNVDSGEGGFIFQGEFDDNLIISDSSWKIKKHPAYGSTKNDPPAYLFGGDNIGFDARYDMPNWITSTFDDSLWDNANEKGRPFVGPWDQLEKRPIPLWKDSGLKNYTNIRTIPIMGGASSIEAILPHAAMITPYFEIEAPAGLTIDIRTDRHSISGGPGDNKHYNGHHTEYITREGKQTFESLDWLFGEKVIYTIPAGVKIISLQYRETGYNTELSGSFISDDAALNTLWKKAQRTLYICMRDNYMDCPDRERGQWIGDVSLQVIQTFYSLSRSSDKLTIKCVNDFVRWRKDDILRGNVPGIHSAELPSQSLHALSKNGIMMPYFQNTGDKSLIKTIYPAAIKYLELWDIKEDGLVKARKGNWQWYDHLDHQDKEVLENCWYYAALTSVREMANLIGKSQDNEWLDRRINSLKTSIEKEFWTPNGYKSDVLDERANALAVVFGLASEDKYPKIRNVLVEQDYCTPYMEAYVLEALFIMGYADDAYARMKRRYDEMITSKVSTLWEDFSGHGTLNHAWSGAPLSILSKYGAGVASIEPGWETFSVLPQMGPLKTIKIKIPSIKGMIKLELKNDNLFSMKLKSPENTTAIIGIPDNKNIKVKGIKANGKYIWKNGKTTGNVSGVKFIEHTKDYIKFSLIAGDWSIIEEK